jgi:CheY-like chemotaxis protein
MMFSVTDSGTGIDEKDLTRIFEPFFTTKGKGKGTGLGLAMVYGIIKQHEGFFNILSEKGFGTTFEVFLPALAQCKKKLSSAKNEEKATVRGTGTILLAEDEEAVRDFLQDALEFYGFRTIVAVDGEDAIKKYTDHKHEIDMVMLDVVMPKKNGKEVYNAIKQTDPGIKALFISGYTEDILTSKGIYEEGLEFMSKPLEIESVVKKIRSVLSRR